MNRPPVSGVVICFNEQDTIERCLRSLEFCDELVVVDSLSTDATRELASRYTDRVIDQPFLGYVKQKRFAVEQARHDWVLCIDADEEVSPELAASVEHALTLPDGELVGYRLDRITWFLGTWHDRGEWYPDWQLRLFDRRRGGWTGLDPHDRVELDGPTRDLQGRLYHYNYRDLAHQIQQIDGFTERLAREMRDAGVRFRVRDLLVRPLHRFVKGFVLRGGFLKGLPGFLVSISTAYYVFMKYAKLWELEHPSKR